MAESINPRKEFEFPNNSENFFKLHMIGYHDFRFVETSRFFRVSPWDSVHYVRNGQGKLFVRGREYSVKAGDFFFVEKNESVMYYPKSADPWRYYWVAFRGEAAFKLHEKLGLDSDSPVRHAEHPDKITALLDTLSKEDLTQTALYYRSLATLMDILSIEHSKNSVIKSESHSDSLIENAKRIVELNYKRFDFSVGDIASMLYISERHIRRVFREKLGVTPVVYISDFRLNAARELIKNESCTLEELCSAIGWRNRAYFMNCFKRKYNMTVNEYRKSLKN